MTVDEYLDGAPEPQRGTLTRLRSDLSALLPEGVESISYGMPVLKQGGKAIAGYAYFKAHCSYFPHSGSVLAEIADELHGYEWTKGTLKFPVDQPLPLALLRKLVTTRLTQVGLS